MIIGTSAVTCNPHFTSFLSPFECDQSLGALSQWPPVPVLLVLDSFPPSQRTLLLQQAFFAWARNLDSEQPKKSRILHKEEC